MAIRLKREYRAVPRSPLRKAEQIGDSALHCNYALFYRYAVKITLLAKLYYCWNYCGDKKLHFESRPNLREQTCAPRVRKFQGQQVCD